MSTQKSTSPRACSIGLPISRTMIPANSSLRSEWNSDTFLTRAARSATVVFIPQSRWAASAAAIAAERSSSEITGYSLTVSPVAGLITAYLLIFAPLLVVGLACGLSCVARRRPGAVAPRRAAVRGRRDLEYRFRRHVVAPDAGCHRRVRHRPVRHVDSQLQAGVVMRSLHHALVGERKHVRKRGVGERVGRRDRHRARHVRDAVVNDPVDLEGR